MKTYATVPLRLKFKRLWRTVSRLSLRFDTDTSVGLCRDSGAEADKTWRLGRSTEIKLVDAVKVFAVFCAVCAAVCLVSRAAISAAVEIAVRKREKKK